MNAPRFAYAQARLAARHAERAQPLDWARLGASRSAEHYLQAVRGTSLERWVRHVDREPAARALEAALDAAFAAHVGEVAEWVDEGWAEPVRFTRWVPALERLEADAFDDAGAGLRGAGAGLRWVARFRALWPRSRRATTRRVEEIVDLVAHHRRAMRDADPEDGGWALRAALARALERRFRAYPATPAAVLSHLGLTWLELERLRGELVVRLLLPRGESDGTWA